jgi:hypothetical protein
VVGAAELVERMAREYREAVAAMRADRWFSRG